MKTLFIKGLIFLIPIILVIAIYIIIDPGKKVWNYDNYVFDFQMLNKGDVCTKLILKNNNKYHYNSFIFGSSISCATTSASWKKYLLPQSVPFSYGSWSEQLIGIERKIKVLDSLQFPINNALIVIDASGTFKSIPYLDPVKSDHYLISGESKFEYYKTDFRDWLRHPVILLSSLDYSIFHKRRHYMKEFVDPQYGGLSSINGDWRLLSDKLIEADSVNYYNECKHSFYKRPLQQQYANAMIDAKKKSELLEIFRIFQKNKTHYKLLISPLYDQIKLNPKDFAVLVSIFGSENIFDFSGINDITNNMYNYGHDVFHYRIRTGDLLLQKIYAR